MNDRSHRDRKITVNRIPLIALLFLSNLDRPTIAGGPERRQGAPVSIRRGTIFFLCIWAALFSLFHQSALGSEGLFKLSAGKLQILDFAYHWAIVRGFWWHDTGGISSAGALIAALTPLLGAPPPAVMPNPMSPTIVMVWLPLALLPIAWLREAYLLWLSFSIALCAAAFAMTFGLKCRRRQRFLAVIAVFFVAVSPVFANGVILGQTTACVLGVLLLIVKGIHRAEKISLRSDLLLAGALSILSVKLPYLLIGVGLLGIFHRWRAIFYGVALIILLVLIASVWADPGWLGEYVLVMQSYSRRDFSAGGFVWGDYGATTPTVTTMLRPVVSSQMLGFFSFGAAVGAAVVVAKLVLRPQPLDRGDVLLVGVITLVGTYLLFAPYLGSYEDLLLLLPVVVLYLVAGDPRVRLLQNAALVVALGSLYSDFFPLAVGVFLKALTLVLLLLTYRSDAGRERISEVSHSSLP